MRIIFHERHWGSGIVFSRSLCSFLLVLVNGRRSSNGAEELVGSEKQGEEQLPFIVVAAAVENDASSDPNEAFIPTKDDNGANRPAFNLLSNADLQREQLRAEVIEGERLHSNDYLLGTLPEMGMTNLVFSISNVI